MRVRMKVCIRGIVYDNVEEAAKANNVKPCTIYDALRRNKLDGVGTGQGNRVKCPRSGRAPMPVTIASVYFKSRSEAAEKLGYDKGHLCHILNYGGVKATKKLEERALMWYQNQQKEARCEK